MAASLFTSQGRRKYLNATERERFLKAAQTKSEIQDLFCRTLLWTGGRLSEVLALRSDNISAEEGVIVFRTLKKRNDVQFRQVPVPEDLIQKLAQHSSPIFPWGRTQAWSIIKDVMTDADITGPQACPRGLRHSFAVHAVTQGVPLHLVQRWLGHAKLETTAIYSQAIGPEERLIAQRMWHNV